MSQDILKAALASPSSTPTHWTKGLHIEPVSAQEMKDSGVALLEGKLTL